MPISRFSLLTGFCIVLASASAGWAQNVREKLFEQDKAAALADFNATQEKACVKELNRRYQSRYSLNDALSFNEPFSLAAYDNLFWKGKGGVQRGLIFTAPVADRAGGTGGKLICYYAMTDNRLDFQSAYVLPIQQDPAQTALREKALAPSRSITLASKQ